ncbi:acetyl-CoA synthetase-like protein [Xylaria nigripes]|nr:acetyl-CoA synthetase-like protein [Xylaria nigripes]
MLKRVSNACFQYMTAIYEGAKKKLPRPVPCRIDDLILERCRSQPTSLAVSAWDGDFSYADLECLSSAVAQRLIKFGVGPEVFVPVCFDKSKWTTVAMLGVIRAGGAFLLLDTSHPVTRLRSICQSISARVSVASRERAHLAADLVTTVLEIGGETTFRLVDGDTESPCSSATAENALYAVSTSGSTGSPKIVVNKHASLHAAVSPYVEAVKLNLESRVFQYASYAFDVTIFDTIMTLISGGCLCVPSNTDRWSDVSNAIRRSRATHVSLTPTVARILDPRDLPDLKTLVLGGEKLEAADFAKWVDNVRVVHLYGASEYTIISIQSMTSNKPYPVEHPTGNIYWVVNPYNHGKLLPVGAIGELIVEGPMISRGYLNNQEKTAASFIDPPSWLCQLRGDGDCGIIYKSGDLVRYVGGGPLQYVGRKDTQAKLHGQRIELGEIEKHLGLVFPSASHVVAEVVSLHDSSRPSLLVAFVHDRDDSDPEGVIRESGTNQILDEPTSRFHSRITVARSQLEKSLPSYMVPAVFLPLATLPLTSTDKINRKLLREVVTALKKEKLEQYQPLTGILRQYFARVLDLSTERVGGDDHFFHCGGDSLSAIKLVAMARKDNFKLTVQDIFDHPRLSALACVVRSGWTVKDGNNVSPEPFSLVHNQREVIRSAAQQCQLPVRSIEDIYPCTPLQRGLMSETMRDPKAFISKILLPLPRNIDIQRLQTAWVATAKANPILRTRVVLSPSYGLLQVVVREDIRWTVSKSNEIRTVVGGIGKPLVELFLCQHGQDKQLIMTIHHVVYDGWTLPLLFTEVEAALQGRTLVPHPVGSFIRYLQSIPDRGGYWGPLMENLQAPVFPALPAKTYRPSPNAELNAAISIPASSTRQFAPSTYVRLAWALTQTQYQGSDDVFFGTVVSGRNAPVADIESMTVPTAATIPCRVTINPQSSVRVSLHRVQDDMISSIPFEQIGITDISRLSPGAALACSFQTLLVMQPAVKPHAFSWLKQIDLAINYRPDATYAITIICGFEDEILRVVALFDHSIVTEDKMQRILADFGGVLKNTYEKPDSLVSEILVARI